MEYTLDTLNIEQITNLYLYGTLEKPADLTSDSLIRPPDVADDQDAITIVHLDAVSFMTSGPGRFANSQQSPLVKAFMEGDFMAGDVPVERKEFSVADLSAIYTPGSKKLGSFSIQQWSYVDGTDDHGERTYIYNSSAFRISTDAVFVIEVDGTRHIENYAILPFADNFDFKSDDGLANYGNPWLEQRIDPSKIGRRVDIVFDNSSKDQIPRIDYTLVDYLQDYDSFSFNSGLGVAELAVEMSAVVQELWDSGVTKFIDEQGRPILYGTDNTDNLSVSKYAEESALITLFDPFEEYFEAHFAEGVTLVGGAGNDYLTGGAGDDTLNGGEGIDTYVISGHDRIIDEGQNNILFNGSLITGVFKFNDQIGAYQFISDCGEYQLEFNTTGGLTLSAEDSITFVNQTSAAAFTDHDFGINLLKNPDLVYDWTFAATALNYEAYAIKGGTQGGKQWYWYAYGDSNTSDTKTFFEDLIPSLTISGNSGDDYLYGLNRADMISGGSGNDMILGEWGYLENGTYYNIPGPSEGDQLDGGIGIDLILGSRAADILTGGEDNDFLSGLEGDDIVRGDSGNDAVTGGSHNDILSGGAGDDMLFGDGYLVFSGATVEDLPAFSVQYTFAANGYPTGYTTTRFSIATDAENSGDDILSGGGGRDWLDGGVGADMLDGGSESDSLFGGEGDDWLFGGEGNDWLVGDNGDLSGSGNDTLAGGAGNDMLYGLGGNDTLMGDAGADELYGFAGDDSLSGGSEDDYLSGGEGDDTLHGGAGADELQGQNGNDTLYGDDGDDFLLGDNGDNSGNGQDQLYGGAGNDQLQGAGGNDSLNGDAGDDILFGELGDDQLEGGTGNDYLDGGEGNDGYFFSLGDGNDYVNDAAGMSRITFTDEISLESVSFSWAKKVGTAVTADPDGNDLLIQYSAADSVTIANGRLNTNYDLWMNGEQISYPVIKELAGQQITGTDGDDELTGGRGGDTLIAGAGNDVLDGGDGADKLDGGDGIDSVSYANSTTGISVSLSAGRGYSGSALGDTLIACENLTGSAYDDMLTGNSTNNVLIGNNGNDRLAGGSGTDSLYGGGGNDILEGNAGADALFGGTGDDEYLVYRSDGIDFFDDQEGSNTVTFKFAVPFSNITVNPASYSDGQVIEDKQGPNIQVRYSTTDSLIIANGRSNLGFTYNFGSGPILTHAQLLYYLSEEIIGTDGNDVINAQGGDDTVYGGNGNDTLDGGEGTNRLYGGDGDDTFIIGNGSNYIDGGAGFDTIDYSKAPEYWPGLKVDLEAGATQKSPSYSDTYVSIENVIGSLYNDTLLGDLGNNRLNGNAGDDILIGKSGDDCLIGDDGNDILDGGSGADVLDGGNGLDRVSYASSTGGIIVNLVEGTGSGGDAEGDTYLSIENIEGTSFDDIIIGDEGNNEIIGRYGGTPTNGDLIYGDQIYGGKGEDRIIANGKLYGEEGNDYIEVNYDFNSSEASSLFGGLGDDVLVGELRYGGYGWFPRLPDAITMDGGEGNDFLYTEQPAIMFGGDGNDTLLNHAYKISARMEGGNGDDILIAQGSRNGGMDILKGGAGNDLLEGGFDNDSYLFSAGDGFDIIADSYWDDDIYGNLSKHEFVHFEDIESIVKISVHFASFTEEKKWEERLPFFSNGDPVDYYRIFTNDSSQVVEDAEGEELLIRYGNGDAIVIVNGRTNLNYSFSFADGNEHSHAEMLALAMVQQNHAPELLSAVQDQHISSGEIFSYTLSADIFVDPDTGDTLSFSATLADGNALPLWLNFDAATRTFSGTPTSPGLTSVRVTSTDAGNLSTSDIFDIVVKPQGLLLTGTVSADSLRGKDGDDTLYGLDGNDRLRGEAGNDQLFGGLGNDTLRGGLGADILDGGDGIDTTDYRDSLAAVTVDLTTGTAAGGSAEGDSLVSIENIHGSGYADTFTGSVGKNTLIGYGGDDVLCGLEGNDRLRGEAGIDRLFGGLGNDSLTGGSGNDFFVFDTALNARTNKDSITDFAAGLDKLQLDKSIFTSLVEEGTLSSAFFNSSATGVAGDADDYFFYNTSSGALLYDADGNGQGVAIQFATLITKPMITANDFLVTA